MKQISELLSEKKVRNILFLFPHFDDCAFVSSGLIQLANKLGIETHVYVTYEKDDPDGEKEFNEYSRYLDVNSASIIKTTHEDLLENIDTIIKKHEPNMVVTFDPGGVTGNTHHTLVSLKTYEALKSLKNKNMLLWRVADSEEEGYFGKMPRPLNKEYSPTYKIDLSLSASLKKLRAILMNKTKVRGFLNKLRFIEWYLLDHKEKYYLVNFAKDKFNIKYPKFSGDD